MFDIPGNGYATLFRSLISEGKEGRSVLALNVACTESANRVVVRREGQASPASYQSTDENGTFSQVPCNSDLVVLRKDLNAGRHSVPIVELQEIVLSGRGRDGHD